MANSVTWKVEGLAELQKRFLQLENALALRIARQATNAGAQVIKREAMRRAPIAKRAHLYYPEKGAQPVLIQPGNLRKNVVVRRTPPRKTPYLSEHVITVRHKGRNVVGDPFLEGVLAEYGSVKNAATPWLRPAMAVSRIQAVNAVKAKLMAALTKAGV